jgi:hypothetical protein
MSHWIPAPADLVALLHLQPGGGSMSAAAQRTVPMDDLPPAVDMTDEAQKLALAYSGDASWESIRLLRADILRSTFERMAHR